MTKTTKISKKKGKPLAIQPNLEKRLENIKETPEDEVLIFEPEELKILKECIYNIQMQGTMAVKVAGIIGKIDQMALMQGCVIQTEIEKRQFAEANGMAYDHTAHNTGNGTDPNIKREMP